MNGIDGRLYLICAAVLIFALRVTAQTTPGPQPNICNRSCWGARAPNCGLSTMSALTRAIVHHTAAASDWNTTTIETSKPKVRGIQNYHMDTQGWCDAGYHFVVDKLGNVFEGRANSMTTLRRGIHDACNGNSFGFTLLGYFHPPHEHVPTPEMLNAYYNVIAWRMPHGWSPYGSGTYCSKTVGFLDGHRKVVATACPGNNVHPNLITENYNGGPMRTEVAARRGGMDNAVLVSKTVANGAQFAPNQSFSCTYTMNNNGTTTWAANGGSGYTLNYVSGTQMGAANINPISANVSAGGNASITVNFTAPAVPGPYTVTFQMNNSAGAFFGQQVPLNINVVTLGPTINPQPQSQTVNPGANVNFTVGATGAGSITYQWRKDNVNLSNGGKFSGVTTTNLSVTGVSQNEVGIYSVAATDANGTTVSASASLAVNTVIAFNETFESGNLNNWGLATNAAAPAATMLAISTAQHNGGGSYSAQIDISSDRMFRNIGAEIAGRGKATFYIYDGTQSRVFTEVRSYSGNGFEQGSLQQLLAIGKYNNATMPGQTPYNSAKYQGRITFGATVGWFNLDATGSPNRSTGWHKFEIERLADQSTVNWYVDGILSKTFSGLTSPAWDCVVVGSVGAGSTGGDAWVDDFKVEYYDPPTITTDPLTRTNAAGSTATFTVVASGTVNSFQWRKNGVNLSNGGKISGATSPALTINNAQADDAANYDVLVVNGAGPDNSVPAALWVAPSIVSQPVNSTNLSTTTATFTVAAAGQGPLSFQWRRNGTNLVNGANIVGAETEMLTLNSVTPGDAGEYSVVVTNVAGQATSTAAMLVVVLSPAILVPPSDVSVPLGSNATFTVTADGTPPLFYQWRFNEENILGATNSSYTRFGVAFGDVGDYSVAVSNAADTVVSLAAALTVITPDPVIQSFGVSGGNFTLTWNALNGKNYRVQFKNHLNDSSWTDLPPDVTAGGSVASKSDAIANAQRYYRIIALD